MRFDADKLRRTTTAFVPAAQPPGLRNCLYFLPSATPEMTFMGDFKLSPWEFAFSTK